MMPFRHRLFAVAALVSAPLVLPAAAGAADEEFVIRGAGFGHGVGMSQYGAYGFAQQGRGYREILAHYYTGTAIGSASPGQVIRVLLRSTPAHVGFAGATKASGRKLDPAKTYYARNAGAGMVDLLSPKKRRLKRFPAPLRISGARALPIRLAGPAINGRSDGTYRGAFEFHPNAAGGLDAINHVRLDDYVQGVVPVESPSYWPAEALKAQAVAARTYAITTSRGTLFDHYPDVRSQVYGGVAVEVASTNSAVQATRGEVVTHGGKPVVTYFFSTSGGRTEDVENTTLGNAPLPWLRSVDDPYDNVSPRHRWGPIRLTFAQARKKLGSALVKGDFLGIEVLQRGASPRIVVAEVIGTEGRVRTDGATLRRKLGLYDSWAEFTTITTGEEEPPEEDPIGSPTPQAAGDHTRVVYRPPSRAVAMVAGRVLPAGKGSVIVVERRAKRGKWVRVGSAYTAPTGRYAFPAHQAGTYRVRYRGEHGAAIRID